MKHSFIYALLQWYVYCEDGSGIGFSFLFVCMQELGEFLCFDIMILHILRIWTAIVNFVCFRHTICIPVTVIVIGNTMYRAGVLAAPSVRF